MDRFQEIISGIIFSYNENNCLPLEIDYISTSFFTRQQMKAIYETLVHWTNNKKQDRVIIGSVIFSYTKKSSCLRISREEFLYDIFCLYINNGSSQCHFYESVIKKNITIFQEMSSR